ncbi:MAG: DUF502 domain-containing protein [Candidatus Krumholzibacteria bacterium]|nr:DUF502 domain-containing protein [Candidatus Krumholzibacteria bacterium]
MGWFRRNFFTGLVILLPTVITAWVFYRFFISIDSILKPLVAKYPFLDFPGLGFISIVLIIMITGVFAGNLIGRKIIGWVESVVTRIPLISRIYVAIKQIAEVFLQQERTVFRKVILIQYPRPGIYVVGFVTSKWKFRGADGKEQTFMNVFLPTTPNPTSGLFLMIPENEAITLDCSIEDALKMVISGGAVLPFIYSLIPDGRVKGREETDSP